MSKGKMGQSHASQRGCRAWGEEGNFLASHGTGRLWFHCLCCGDEGRVGHHVRRESVHRPGQPRASMATKTFTLVSSTDLDADVGCGLQRSLSVVLPGENMTMSPGAAGGLGVPGVVGHLVMALSQHLPCRSQHTPAIWVERTGISSCLCLTQVGRHPEGQYSKNSGLSLPESEQKETDSSRKSKFGGSS